MQQNSLAEIVKRENLNYYEFNHPSITEEEYGEDYFERGFEKGISCFSMYRWLPELTTPMAMAMVDHLGIRRQDKILDFGSSKGYLVRAFRLMLYRQAWGCDISEYAISQVDKEIKQYCRLSTKKDPIPFDDIEHFEYIVSKDTLEHIPEDRINELLNLMSDKGYVLFAIIPLGVGNTNNVPAYNIDKTHKIAKPAIWWAELFEKTGWFIDDFSYCIEGIKDSWNNWKYGNSFFTLTSKKLYQRHHDLRWKQHLRCILKIKEVIL